MNAFLTIVAYGAELLILLGVVALCIPPLVRGAPFVPSHKSAVERIVALLQPMSGQVVADVGSGEGRILIALLQAGASEAHGYEINPFLVLYSRWKIRRAGFKGKGFIHWKSLWRVNYKAYDIITVFGFPSMMKHLEEKLQHELLPGARVVSCLFPFPTWQHSDQRGRIFLYEQEGKQNV